MYPWHADARPSFDAAVILAVCPAVVGGLISARVGRILPWLAGLSSGALAARLLHDGIESAAAGGGEVWVQAAWALCALAAFGIVGHRRRSGSASRSTQPASPFAAAAAPFALAFHRFVEAATVATTVASAGVSGVAAGAASATHAAIEGSATASAASVHGLSPAATKAWVVVAGSAPLLGLAVHQCIGHVPAGGALASASLGILSYVAVTCFRHARSHLRAGALLPVLLVGFSAALLPMT